MCCISLIKPGNPLFKAEQVFLSGESLTSIPQVEGCDLHSRQQLTSKSSDVTTAAEHKDIHKFTKVHRRDLFPRQIKCGVFQETRTNELCATPTCPDSYQRPWSAGRP